MIAKLVARLRLARIRKGSSGCATRRSIRTNSASRVAPTASEAMRQRVAPAVVGVAGAGEAVDDPDEAGGAGQRAGQVQLARVPVALGEEVRRGEGRGQADRDVDEERQPPPGDVDAEQGEVEPGEPAAEDQADGRAGPGHRGVDGERAVALGAGREGRGDQRQGGGGGDRGAEALQAAGGQQHRLALGEPADQRGDREDHHTEHEDPAAAVEVTEAAAEQQEPAEHQGVAGHHPGQVGDGEAQVGLDVGQRDVGDGAVEHHHQLGHRDEHERPAEVTVAGRRRCRRGTRCGGRAGGVGHEDPSGVEE